MALLDDDTCSQSCLSAPRPATNLIQLRSAPAWLAIWRTWAGFANSQLLLDAAGRDCPTNLANSKYTVWLYMESNSGIPHLHAAVCRMDEDGKINNDHNIHLRAQWAAERVAKKRGWTTAKQVRNVNIPLVTRDCMNVLKSMSSWDEYKDALTKIGYTIHERKDDDGILHGYAIMKGKTKYKASDLGIGRNLMVSKLPTIWEKLHYRSGISANNKPKNIDSKQTQKASASADYTQYKNYNPNTVPYTLSHEGQEHRFYIPERFSTILTIIVSSPIHRS